MLVAPEQVQNAPTVKGTKRQNGGQMGKLKKKNPEKTTEIVISEANWGV